METKLTNDQTVIQLQNILACKKEELVKVKPSYVTNMQFRFYTGGPITNLHTISDVSSLLKMYACVRGYFTEYQMAISDLKYKNPPVFKWEGFELNDWHNDIKTRLDILDYQAKLLEYQTLEKRLLALESDDLKTTKELEAIMALLDK